MNILRTDIETGEETVISMEEAVEKLTGWWTNPQELLIQGMALYTPYAEYKLKD